MGEVLGEGKAQQEVLTRIEKEVEDRVAKADEALNVLKEEAENGPRTPSG